MLRVALPALSGIIRNHEALKQGPPCSVRSIPFQGSTIIRHHCKIMIFRFPFCLLLSGLYKWHGDRCHKDSLYKGITGLFRAVSGRLYWGEVQQPLRHRAKLYRMLYEALQGIGSPYGTLQGPIELYEQVLLGSGKAL